MRIRTVLGAIATMGLFSTGCHHYVPAQDVHIDKPGVHVVNSYGTTSVVWATDNSVRVCTLQKSGGGMHGHGKGRGRNYSGGGGRGAGARHPVDTLFFRLCEARGNNDLSAEEYSKILAAIGAHMSGPMAHGGGHGFHKGFRHRPGDSADEGADPGPSPNGPGGPPPKSPRPSQ